MKTSLEISEEFEIAHSRIISLIDKLYKVEEYSISYEIEEYKHITLNNKREIRAYKMEEQFYILVILHLPLDKRVMKTKWIIDAIFLMVDKIDTRALNDKEFMKLSKLGLECIEIDIERKENISNAMFDKMFSNG